MRSDILDRRVAPVVNLDDNPSLNRVTSGTTILRRNLLTSPYAVSSWSKGFGTGGVGTAVIVSDARFPGGVALKMTWTTLPTSNNGLQMSTGSVAVTPGRVYLLSLRYEMIGYSGFVPYFYLPNGGTMKSRSVNLGNGLFEFQVMLRAQAVDTTKGITISSSSSTSTMVANASFSVGGARIEEVSDYLPYFDGSTTDDTGFAYSWEGVVNASTSVAKAAAVELCRNILKNPGARSGGSAWGVQNPGTAVATATYVSSAGPNGESVARLTLTTSPGVASQYRFRIGGGAADLLGTPTSTNNIPVALSFDVKVHASMVGQTVTVELPIVGPEGGLYTNVVTFVGAAGWQRIVRTKTLVIGGTLTSITNTNPPQIVTPAINLNVGDVIIEVANALYEYANINRVANFDGYISSDPNTMPSWIGAVNASASIISAAVLNSHTAHGTTTRVWRSTYNDAPVGCFFTNGGSINNGLNRIGFTGQFLGLMTYTVRIVALATISSSWVYGIDSVGDPIGGGFTIGVTPTTVYRTFSTAAAGPYSRGFIRAADANAQNSILTILSIDIVQGVYAGPHFDGSTPRCIWRGIPHASQSVGYVGLT